MHIDMNMSMSMHMRMGTTTGMAIALGTSIDLELNPYGNSDGYECGHAYDYAYAYVCRLHRPPVCMSSSSLCSRWCSATACATRRAQAGCGADCA